MRYCYFSGLNFRLMVEIFNNTFGFNQGTSVDQQIHLFLFKRVFGSNWTNNVQTYI